MSSHFQHTTISYDISDILEHNDRIIEDDDHWKFMGPLLYNSSSPGCVVPGSIVMKKNSMKLIWISLSYNLTLFGMKK